MTQTPAADIVKRLRSEDDTTDLLSRTEAATEIEALRAANTDLKLHFDTLMEDYKVIQRKLDEVDIDAISRAIHAADLDSEGLPYEQKVYEPMARAALASIRGEG